MSSEARLRERKSKVYIYFYSFSPSVTAKPCHLPRQREAISVENPTLGIEPKNKCDRSFFTSIAFFVGSKALILYLHLSGGGVAFAVPQLSIIFSTFVGRFAHKPPLSFGARRRNLLFKILRLGALDCRLKCFFYCSDADNLNRLLCFFGNSRKIMNRNYTPLKSKPCRL